MLRPEAARIQHSWEVYHNLFAGSYVLPRVPVTGNCHGIDPEIEEVLVILCTAVLCLLTGQHTALLHSWGIGQTEIVNYIKLGTC